MITIELKKGTIKVANIWSGQTTITAVASPNNNNRIFDFAISQKYDTALFNGCITVMIPKGDIISVTFEKGD